MNQLREYYERRELLSNLVLRELRSRYKRSALGWTWSLLNPLSSVLIYWVVFGVFLKVKAPIGDPSGQGNFVLFLLCALIPWNFFSNGVTQSIESLVVNAGLIRKVYFPRELLVASTIGGLLVTFMIELGVVVVILLVAGNMILPWLPIVVLLVILQTLLVLGIGLLLSGANVYFRDVRHFVNLLMPMLFYSTPVVYPISYVPVNWQVAGRSIPLRSIYEMNPLVQLVGAYRALLYDLTFPSIGSLAYIAVWSIGLVLIGQFVFNRLDHRLAEEV
jgi:ABC-type polysaccharide/polyol phosphate export permease